MSSIVRVPTRNQLYAMAEGDEELTRALELLFIEAFGSASVLSGIGSGAIVFSNGTTLIGDNAFLFWDNTNKRLGIGTATPSESLDLATGNLTTGGDITADTITATTLFTGPNVTSGTDPGHIHTDASLDLARNASASVSTSTALTLSYGFVFADASSGAITLTLPAAGSSNEWRYYIKKTDSSANFVTMAGTIDGATNFDLELEGESITIYCDGTEWFIV